MDIKARALLLYRKEPALFQGMEGGKLNILLPAGETVKVREKDVEIIYPEPCPPDFSLKNLGKNPIEINVREIWELMLDEDAGGSQAGNAGLDFVEFTELVFGKNSPENAWAARALFDEGFYFTGELNSIRARPRALVEGDEKKREEKEREGRDRALFLEKLKNSVSVTEFSPEERAFLQDAEALARGLSDKSRLLKELGRTESPEEAHKLLLTSGAWTIWDNPHPHRYGFSKKPEAAKSQLNFPDIFSQYRVDLTHLPAYAIDSPWSKDPDDAISLEEEEPDGSCILWVHTADPASMIEPGSSEDIHARDRGSTLYLPEGAHPMLREDILAFFALKGQSMPDSPPESRKMPQGQVSPALSFKINLSPSIKITKFEVFSSLIRAERLTYAQADDLIDVSDSIIAKLFALAQKNVERRLDTGAVMIEMPEVNVHVDPAAKEITIQEVVHYRSTEIVRECMVLAGEGAAHWALHNKIPFPYISQEAGDLPEKRLTGLAGAYQIRRCMRPRSLSIKPGVHWGLGLDEYTQVTSPLRRYTDLLCHQQIRAFLKGEKPLTEDEVLQRIAAADAASHSAIRAERASKIHWINAYLSQRKDSIWDGIILDLKGSRAVVFIPALGMETNVNIKGNLAYNDKIKLKLSSVRMAEGETVFSAE